MRAVERRGKGAPAAGFLEVDRERSGREGGRFVREWKGKGEKKGKGSSQLERKKKIALLPSFRSLEQDSLSFAIEKECRKGKETVSALACFPFPPAPHFGMSCGSSLLPFQASGSSG